MSAANRGARYGLETPSSYGRIFPQRAVPTAKFLRAIRGCRRRFPARRTQGGAWGWLLRSEEHTSELQSLMRISYADFFLKKKKIHINTPNTCNNNNHNYYYNKTDKHTKQTNTVIKNKHNSKDLYTLDHDNTDEVHATKVQDTQINHTRTKQ